MQSDAAEASRPTVSRRRTWAFRLIAVALGMAPLVLLELLCILAGWGLPAAHDDPFVGFDSVVPLFVLSEDGQRYETSKSRLNFFTAASFPAEKPANEYRIFCLGGSTVQGEPFDVPTSFTTWLELGLQAADPSRDWRVVNCGGVSYATYRLVPILQEVLKHQPDLVIFYEGHNEFLEGRSYEPILARGRLVNAALEAASRLRTFTLARAAYLRLVGAAPGGADQRALLPSEVEALLDYRGGLEEYHRDDAGRQAVIDHFRFNLERIVALTRAAGVPLVLMNPVSNLADSPPFKSEHRADLSDEELAEWTTLSEQGHADLRGEDHNLARATRLFERATEIDPRHAGGWYSLAKCYESAGDYGRAREAFIRAKDEDVCPLRILEPMHQAVLDVAAQTGTPLVDARRLFESKSPHELVGGQWLVDHVHPGPEGHQLLSDALLEKLIELDMVRPQDHWQQRKSLRYREHYDALGNLYFIRGTERLARLRGWARGRAEKLRSEAEAKP